MTGQKHRLLSKAEIVQRLNRMDQYKGMTMKGLAAACDRSRQALYEARQGLISDELQQLLSQALQRCQPSECVRNPDLIARQGR